VIDFGQNSHAMTSLNRSANSWQLILADLALILFLISASVLVSRNATSAKADPQDLSEANGLAQAIWRSGPQMPGDARTLRKWLEMQPLDPRARLKIMAVYRRGDERLIWNDAQAMASHAEALGLRSRIVIEAGDETGIEARLVYDSAL